MELLPRLLVRGLVQCTLSLVTTHGSQAEPARLTVDASPLAILEMRPDEAALEPPPLDLSMPLRAFQNALPTFSSSLPAATDRSPLLPDSALALTWLSRELPRWASLDVAPLLPSLRDETLYGSPMPLPDPSTAEGALALKLRF